MFKKTLIASALLAALSPALAQTTQTAPAKPAIVVPAPTPDNAKPTADAPKQPAAPTMPTESGLKAKPMQIEPNAPRPTTGMGRLVFAYGASLPTITCAPLHICVINLMPGEIINDLSIGDSVRWLVSTSQAGDRPVVILKPTHAGTATNLVITTNKKRVYYFMLESNDTKYLPIVDFYDPQELLIKNQHREAAQAGEAQAASMAALQKMAADAEKKSASMSQGFDPAKLDFNYTCTSEGGDDFKPTKVFNGDGKTYISMPPEMKYGDAPAVFNMSTGEAELINSRLTRDYYILDGVPAKFKLVVGSKQVTRSVTCERGSKSGFFGLFGK